MAIVREFERRTMTWFEVLIHIGVLVLNQTVYISTYDCTDTQYNRYTLDYLGHGFN